MMYIHVYTRMVTTGVLSINDIITITTTRNNLLTVFLTSAFGSSFFM